MSFRYRKLFQLVLAAMFLALAMVLPFLTGQVPQIGNMLCPMHIPVLLCGFFCGPWYGGVVGAVAPILRFALFGMPYIFPTGMAMCFELAVYGLVSGTLYRRLPKKIGNIYISLLAAMLAGRIMWGIVQVIIWGFGKSEFGWAAFLSGAFTTALPGIVLQIVLIPILVITVRNAVPMLSEGEDYGA